MRYIGGKIEGEDKLFLEVFFSCEGALENNIGIPEMGGRTMV